MKKINIRITPQRAFLLIIFAFFLALGCIRYTDYNSWLLGVFPKLIDSLYLWTKCSIGFNILSLLTLASLDCVYFIYRKKAKVSIVLIGVELFFLFHIFFNDGWIYAKAFSTISYKIILGIAFGWALLTELHVIVNAVQRKRQAKTKVDKSKKTIECIKSKGFLVDDTQNSSIPYGWQTSAMELTERILTTKNVMESYAIGVSGEWGSGKTTYLRYVKDLLSDKCRLIEFNPWNYTSPATLTEDFFNELKPVILENDDSFEKDLTRYINVLTNVGVLPAWVDRLFGALYDKSKSSMRSIWDSINEKIVNFPLKIVVIIDDLDRLNSEELYETLKLIRLSANFGNMFFVAAYDKRHIVEILDGAGTAKGEAYIKKIFQSEILLPGFEPYIIPELLINEIKTLFSAPSVVDNLSSCVYRYDQTFDYYILRFVNNFRDAKRFASSFALALSQIRTDTLDVCDFFWIELLKYYSIDDYLTLKECPSRFLEIKDTLGQSRYQVKKDIKCKSLDANDLLTLIFNKEDGVNDYSVVYKNNFCVYFSYRVNDDKISFEEYKQILNDSDRANVVAWTEKIIQSPHRKIISLLDLFKSSNTNGYSRTESCNFILILCSFARAINHQKCYKLLSDYTRNIKHSSENFTYIRDTLFDFIAGEITHLNSESRSFSFICSTLRALYPNKQLVGFSDEGPDIVTCSHCLSDDDLDELSDKLMLRIIELREESGHIFNVMDLVNDKKLHNFIRSMSVLDYENVCDSANGNTERYYKNLCYKTIRKYFVDNKSQDFLDFTSYFKLSSEEAECACNFDENTFISQSRVNKLFDNFTQYWEFLRDCFDVDKKVLSDYRDKLEQSGIKL